MRPKSRVIGDLEAIYREAYGAAAENRNQERMTELDFGFRRDQVLLEVMLDLRQLLTELRDGEAAASEPSLLDKAKAIRDLARPRPRSR